jgi:hypothetical protein
MGVLERHIIVFLLCIFLFLLEKEKNVIFFRLQWSCILKIQMTFFFTFFFSNLLN